MNLRERLISYDVMNRRRVKKNLETALQTIISDSYSVKINAETNEKQVMLNKKNYDLGKNLQQHFLICLLRPTHAILCRI